MQAYHNDENIKQKYVQRMKDHIAADELIRGEGFNEKGQGCAVGCTLNNYNHKAYQTELGIPEWLARVEDALFEGMNLEKSKTFPLLFLEAIKIGVDLDKIKAPFMIFILESNLSNFDNKEFDYVVNAINTIIELYRIGETDEDKWAAARAAAESAAWAAARAAESAARAAESAARAAARAARAAAWAAAWAAAELAAESADSAESAAFDKYADKLLELLKECK